MNVTVNCHLLFNRQKCDQYFVEVFFSPLIERRILLLALLFIVCKGRWYHLLSLLNKRRSNNSVLHAAVAAALLCTCLPTDFSA
jgi:hypothetical protein